MEEMEASIRADIERAAFRAERVQELQSRCSSLHVERSENGIDVFIGAKGLLENLKYSDAALNMGAAALAEKTMQLVTQGRTELQKNLVATTGEVMGFDDPLVAQLCTENDLDINQLMAESQQKPEDNLQGLL